MSKSITKFVEIKGCAVWACDDNWVPVSQNPQVDNIAISAPDIEFATTDINLMGTLSIPDFTRIDNFQIGVTVPPDNEEAMALFQPGLKHWMISYAVSNFNSQTGLEELSAYRIYAAGYITKIPTSEINKGAEGTTELPMNLAVYKKVKVGSNTAVFDINRFTGKVEINGVNYSQPIDELY